MRQINAGEGRLAQYAGMKHALFGFAALVIASASQADEIPYPIIEEGRDLAEIWCNACHVTGTGTTEDAMDAAPPFATLAPLVDGNPEFYKGFLMNPHEPMKEISLSRSEIDALVAYIRSLAE